LKVLMSVQSHVTFEAFLDQHGPAEWAGAVAELLPSIHEVDRTATQVWFRFFPLELLQALERADDPARLASELQLQGNYLLNDQIDTSHRFLYGHRYWPQARAVVIERAEAWAGPGGLALAGLVREVAAAAAKRVGAHESLLVGISAVALMTLQQVGLEAFKASPGVASVGPGLAGKTPEQVLAERARDDRQGLFGLFRSVDKHWTVTFDENDPEGKYKLINNQDLATAGSRDTRDYKSRDPRCVEGPIPVECRTVACGTCWVGVLGGAEKLRPVEARERLKIREFGYVDTDDPHPVIRMACAARATGAVSIVVPPWSGYFGKYLERERGRSGSAAD
jgi:ferredoxin